MASEIFSSVPVWILIAAAVVVILVVLFRTMNQVYLLSLFKKNFFYIFAIAVILFVSFSLYNLHTNYDIDLGSIDGVKEAGKIYLGWLGNVFGNMGKTVGYALQQDWTNSTVRR